MSRSPVAQSSSPAPLWSRALRDLPEEHGFVPLKISGTIPEALSGTLYRNGPSNYSRNGQRFQHWFDGDGAVSAVRFRSGQAEGAVRFVDTAGRREELKKGRILYSAYGTLPKSRLARIGGAEGRNGANTSVVMWQGRLLALFEGGLPVELRPEDLTTIGETDLGGVLEARFSAHPHRIPSQKRTFNVTVGYGRETHLEIYELPDEGPARKFARVPMPGPTMVHDFIVSERHLIVFLAPLRLRIFHLLLGLEPFGDAMAWRPELGTEVLVVPFDAPTQPIRIEAPALFTWHYANAFERGGELVVDYVHYPDFDSSKQFKLLAQGLPHAALNGVLSRAVIDLQRKTFRTEALSSTVSEFPRISSATIGKETTVVYLGSLSPESGEMGLPDRLTRSDLRTGAEEHVSFGPGTFVSEPVFVRRPEAKGADDGWIVLHVYDANSDETRAAIVDTRRFLDGEIGAASFGHRIPPTFHGNFVRG